MTDRDFATDPEIAADLVRQARSLRDTTRKGADYDRKPEPVVETWPCRTNCGARVDMTATAIARVADSNRLLVGRGEKPLSKREVMLCPDCRASEAAAATERDRQRSHAIATLTRELRHGVLPWRESAIADELRRLGVDARELIRRINAERATNTGATSARRNSL